MNTQSRLIWFFPVLFFLSGFLAGGELVWAQALCAVVLYLGLFMLLGSELLTRKPTFPRLTVSQIVFLVALVLLALLAEIQGNQEFGWASLKADSLRHSATTWLLLSYSVFCMWIVRNKESVSWVLGALVAIAFLHVVAGILVLSSGVPGYYLQGEYNIYTNLQGGFFNKNSFAAFLNLVLFSALGFYIKTLAKNTPVAGEGWRRLLRSLSDIFTTSSTKWLFVCLFLFIALVASYSRAAIGLSIFGGALFFAMCLVCLNRASPHLKTTLRGFFSLFVSVIAATVLLALIFAQMNETNQLDSKTQALALQAAGAVAPPVQDLEPDLDDELNTANKETSFTPSQYEDSVLGRIQPALDGLKAITNSYWLGVGANNFQWVFMAHRTENSADGYYKYAHSDAIQFLIESGVIGLILYGIVLLVPVLSALRLVLNPVRSTGTKCIALGCMVGVVVVFFHSFIDFPFQIFGVVLPFITLLNFLMILAAPPRE